MKKYACKFCNEWTTRKEARECIMTHVKTNKSIRKFKKKNSNITNQFMLREKFDG